MESSHLSELKKIIDHNSEYLIFGFVHEAQKLLPSDISYFNIIDLISYIIAGFYFIKHEWDKELTNDYYKIDEDCLTVVNGACDCNAYLKGTIEQGIHSFKFKVEYKHDDTNYWWDLVIGLVDETHDLELCMDRQDTWFCGSEAIVDDMMEPYGKILEKDDIIEMIVNLDDKLVKYIINDKDYGKAYNLKKNSKSFRVTVYMYCIGNKLRIIS